MEQLRMKNLDFVFLPGKIIFKALFIPISGSKYNGKFQGGSVSCEELPENGSKLSARRAPVRAAIHCNVLAARKSGAGKYFRTRPGHKCVSNQSLHSEQLIVSVK
jgi:hypothetical protein